MKESAGGEGWGAGGQGGRGGRGGRGACGAGQPGSDEAANGAAAVPRAVPVETVAAAAAAFSLREKPGESCAAIPDAL
jgi:hypothetical protein